MKHINICFTGHRTNKLTYNGSYIEDELTNKIFRTTYDSIVKAIKDYDSISFYVGGAIGYDMLCQYACSLIKKTFSDKKIEIVMSIPFEFQYIKWNDNDKQKYFFLKLECCDKIVYVDTLPHYSINGMESRTYHVAKMQKRNEYMVDNADLVIAYWDKTKGGTKNCIDYAIRNDKQILNVFSILNK